MVFRRDELDFLLESQRPGESETAQERMLEVDAAGRLHPMDGCEASVPTHRSIDAPFIRAPNNVRTRDELVLSESCRQPVLELSMLVALSSGGVA